MAAALRNVVFKNQANKEEVRRCDGINETAKLLGDTNSETQKHLTGGPLSLFALRSWNMSAQPFKAHDSTLDHTTVCVSPTENMTGFISENMAGLHQC